MKKRIIFLVGPTGIGKSAAGVCLAKKINAEIVSCDSMQIYKGMGILTSVLPAKQRGGIKHHLVGVIAPTREYDVSRYRREALKKIKQVYGSGKVPLFVGGTGLYMSILVGGIFKARACDRKIRERLYQETEAKGSLYLWEKLSEVDPRAAERIHPHDTKRIVRALEVFTACGRPISVMQKKRSGLDKAFDIRMFCLNMQRDNLYNRIEKRVDRMFKEGLIKEVRALLKRRLSRTASYAIGIPELRGFFEGRWDLEEAKRMMKRNTRQYAKRQLTWFRKDKRVQWIEVGPQDSAKKTADKIYKILLRDLLTVL